MTLVILAVIGMIIINIMGVITIPWFWVFAPLWIVPLFLTLLFFLGLFGIGYWEKWMNKKDVK